MNNPTRFERLLAFISPRLAHRRMAARRAYEAAKSYVSSDWINASGSSANAEIASGQAQLQQKSRDLARNNPYAVRALNVIVNNTVGAGILANIKGRNKTQTKRLTELWKQVAETAACDEEGRHNFYALQALMMRTTVESGEGLAYRIIRPNSLTIKVLESDFIVSETDVSPYMQGIKLSDSGKPLAYKLYKSHPGERIRFVSSDVVEVESERLAHVFRQERPGQIRGVPWSHAVIETLKDFADFQNATLIARKIAACFVGLITTSGGDTGLDAAQLKAMRESESQMSPGTFRYLGPGEDVKFSNPPGTDGYSEFVRESMRAVAAGYGVSYEAMTGDYSQVNFSSGRMGHIEFRRNIDMWRWNMLIPQFCDPFFKWFLEYAELKGYDTQGVRVEWVPPAHIMIDPTKEIAAEKEAVLAGFKSRSQVIREQGNDPDLVREEIKTEREADSLAELKFDTTLGADAPPPSAEGNSIDEENEADASDEPDSGVS